MKKKTPPSGAITSRDCVLSARLPMLIDGWLLTCDMNRCSERTIGNRRDFLSRLVWYLENRQVKTCDALALKQFFHYLNHGHKEPGGRWGNPNANRPTKPGTAKTYHSVFRAFFNHLMKEGELDSSPLANITPPIDRPDAIQPFDGDQLSRLIAAAGRTRNPKRDKAILSLFLDTALRVSELTALTVGDIDLTRRGVTVENGKGGKARAVFFSQDTCRALYEYLRERGGADSAEPLFLSERGVGAGEGLTVVGFQRLIKRVGTAANITGVRLSPHTLRNTFAVEFLRNGGNQFSLMNVLGHTSVTMTARYVKVAQADIERQMQEFSPVANLRKKRGKG